MTAGSRRLQGLALVLLSGVAFASLGIFNRLAMARGIGVQTALTLRFTVAALLLWLLNGRRPVRLPRAKLLGFLAMGALFVTEAGLFFISSRRIPVALTCLLLYVYPALVMLLAWALRGERPGRAGGLALVLAMAGIALAVGAPARRLDPLGVALGAASSVGYAVYILIGARLQAGVPALAATLWISTCAAALLLLLGLVTGGFHPLAALPAWPAIAGLAIFGTVVPVFLLMAGLARISATQVSIASTIEPVAAAVMGAAFLGEALAPLQLLGGGLVLAAVLLLSAGGRGGAPVGA